MTFFGHKANNKIEEQKEAARSTKTHTKLVELNFQNNNVTF